jgi:hypothetical protein
MREAQIPIGKVVAAIGGVLLIVSLGLDWYDELSGFNSFEVLDLVLVLLALVTLASLAAALGVLRTPLRPGTDLVVGATALIIVLSQLVNHPPAGIERPDEGTGLWLGLAGAALMLAGAVLSTARIAIAVEPRSRGTAAPGAPGPPPPPPPGEEPTIRSEAPRP